MGLAKFALALSNQAFADAADMLLGADTNPIVGLLGRFAYERSAVTFSFTVLSSNSGTGGLGLCGEERGVVGRDFGTAPLPEAEAFDGAPVRN